MDGKEQIREIIEDTPVIMAVKDWEGVRRCTAQESKVVFILFGDVCSIDEIVKTVKDAGKIAICFEVPHESGSLYHMLSHFIYNHLNMTKIESRPIEDRNWEYRFFIDFEGNLADSAVKNALRGLREEARNMKILGNY